MHAISNSYRGSQFCINELNYRPLSKNLVYNFTDETKFYPFSRQEKLKVRQKSKISKKDFIVLSLSKVIPENNIGDIIEQVAIFDNYDEHASNRLIIVGKYDT